MADLAPPTPADDGATILGAFDGSGDDARFVVADVSRDDAWIAIEAAAAVTPSERR